MRKFRKRRRRAGFVVLMSLAIVVLGVALFFRTDPTGTDPGRALLAERVAVPLISEAPPAVSGRAVGEQAAPEKKDAPREAAGAKSADGAKKEKADAPAGAPDKGPPDPKSNDLWMTIPKLGLYDNYVSNSDAHSALDYGAAKRVDTKFPWQDNANTYISGHRLGWPGTASDHQFYNLPLLSYGDKVYLYDANGTTYTYEVTEIFEVSPSETWVTRPEPGKDMVSLQTCIENYGDYWTMGPNWFVRYVVRADRVAVTPA